MPGPRFGASGTSDGGTGLPRAGLPQHQLKTGAVAGAIPTPAGISDWWSDQPTPPPNHFNGATLRAVGRGCGRFMTEGKTLKDTPAASRVCPARLGEGFAGRPTPRLTVRPRRRPLRHARADPNEGRHQGKTEKNQTQDHGRSIRPRSGGGDKLRVKEKLSGRLVDKSNRLDA